MLRLVLTIIHRRASLLCVTPQIRAVTKGNSGIHPPNPVGDPVQPSYAALGRSTDSPRPTGQNSQPARALPRETAGHAHGAMAAARPNAPLHQDLSRLRATTPLAGRTLDLAALIREDRDGR